VSVAWSYLAASSLWSFGYSHEKIYKAADKTQICSPLGTTGSTTCSENSIGEPSRDTAEIAFFEIRHLTFDGKFAFAPRLEFDFKKSVWAGRLPFYFIPNKDGQLTGGLALGYTDSDKFGASVFVSKAFSFTP
jgi:hypothetical protein